MCVDQAMCMAAAYDWDIWSCMSEEGRCILSDFGSAICLPTGFPKRASFRQRIRRKTPKTLPRIVQSLTMIGSMVSFSGCRRMWSFSL